MGRRLAGGVLVAIGLMAGSLAWAGYAASKTVLDPGRSRAIATDLYEDREVRAQLRSSMASALEAAIPDGVRVSRAELVAAADRALDDPAVEALLVGGLIRAHQRLLGEDPNPDEPIVIDGAALARAGRSALVNLRSDLATAVPEPPSVPVELPVDRLPDAGGFRVWLNGAVAVLAAVAVGLVLAAFVVTNDRPRVLRRVGFWAIGTSLFWLAIGFVLPELARLLIPGSAAILSAVWGVAAGGMVPPSITALVAGIAAVVVSLVWAGVAALVGGRSAPRRRGDSAPIPQHAQVQPGGAAHRPAPVPAPPTPRPGASSAPPPPTRPPAPRPTPGPTTPPRGTPVVPAGSVPASTPPPSGESSRSAQPAPKWVEGVGYVDDDPDATRIG